MKRILFCLCFTFILFSCNTNDDSQSPENENFYALTVGNSWIYKYYILNNDQGTNVYTQVIDSVSIIGTEDFNDNTYFKFKSVVSGNDNDQIPWRENGESFKLLRDSVGYLIDQTGFIEFANNDFNERLHFDDSNSEIEIGFNSYAKLQNDEIVFETEAGSFNCLEMIIRYVTIQNGTEKPFKNYHYYSEGLGLISDDYGFVNNTIWKWQRRLDSYALN